jgi:cysteine desulfurase family protein
LYLDHAATSWPKPPEVFVAMHRYLAETGGNPGRSGHRLSIAAARTIYETRECLAQFLQVRDPLRLVFTLNATYALNLALIGVLRPGDRVVASSMEHNSVLRPLRALEAKGVQLELVHCRQDGTVDLEAFSRALTKPTRLVAITHASNVCGTLMPVSEIVRLSHQAGALCLVDASQTVGSVPICFDDSGVDLLAFSGHKGLQGPQGTGGLVLSEHLDHRLMAPLVQGGTGSQSEFDLQPDFLPDFFESGTPNGVGIAGLGAGVRWVQSRGIEKIQREEGECARQLREGLAEIPGVSLFGTSAAGAATAVVSFTFAGLRVSALGKRLDDEFGILSRVGLHCAPAAHVTLGTYPEGTVRLSPGPLTTAEEIEKVLTALRSVAADHT